MAELEQVRTGIQPAARHPIRSEFAGDPGFVDVLAAFVSSLPELGRGLEQHLVRGNIRHLRTQAHQLKGAAGGYGFPLLTALAAALETACEANDADRIADALDRLLACLGRISL